MRHALAALLLGAAAVAAPASAQVETVALDDSPFSLGTLSRAEGAMPPDLWRGASADTVGRLLGALPGSYDQPAFTRLAGRVLLSPGAPPRGADDALAGAKLLAASRAGFYREAAELAALAPALRDQPALAEVVATASLLEGDVAAACRQGADLAQGRTEPFWLKLRLVCYAATDEGAAADLTLGLLRDQGLLTPGDERVFDALIAGGSLGASVSPQGPFQHAAARLLGADVTPAAVPELPADVLAATARDEGTPAQTRAPALSRALAEGLIGRAEGLRLAEGLEGSPLTDAVATALATPEGSPDRTAGVVDALQTATGWQDFQARAILLAPDVSSARLTPGLPIGAGALALGAAVNGDRQAALRLAKAAAAGPEPSELGPTLVGLFTAPPAGLPEADGALPGEEDATSVASLTADALHVAAGGSEGAAALVVLAMRSAPAEGELAAVGEAVTAAMLDQSGQGSAVRARLALDAEGPRVLDLLRRAPTAPAGPVAENASEPVEPAPRIKPGQ